MEDYEAGAWLVFDMLANVPSLFVYVGVYLLISFASISLFRKVGVAEWKAWVPIVREWEMFRLAGMTPWWAVILPVGGGVVAAIGVFAFVIAIIGVIERSISGSVSESIAAGLVGVLVLFAMLIAWAIFTLIIMILMMNQVNRGFGQSLVMTLLGVVCYPAWVAVLGWGSSRWSGEGGVADTRTRIRFPDGTEVAVRGDRVVVGTSSTSDGLPARTQLITITDASGSVAPFHAQFDRVGSTWQVSDLNTLTGTYVIDQAGYAHRLVQPVAGVTSIMLGQVRVDIA